MKHYAVLLGAVFTITTMGYYLCPKFHHKNYAFAYSQQARK